MSDLALTYDPTAAAADRCVVDGDLAMDDGLSSLVLMSLLTDARATPQDVDPGKTDLRGCWGDALSDRPLGGRFWSLGRAKATDENIRRARDFVREALAWLMIDGIAGQLDVDVLRIDGDGLGAGPQWQAGDV